jgi:hypothetical protein
VYNTRSPLGEKKPSRREGGTKREGSSVVITGSAIGSSNALLLFSDGVPGQPQSELRFQPDDSGKWRYGPSDTLIRTPGCYVFHVKGDDFDQSIAFRQPTSGLAVRPATEMNLGSPPAACRRAPPGVPVLLAVDQQLGERPRLRVPPELADPVGSLEVGSVTWSSSARGAGPSASRRSRSRRSSSSGRITGATALGICRRLAVLHHSIRSVNSSGSNLYPSGSSMGSPSSSTDTRKICRSGLWPLCTNAAQATALSLPSHETTE